METKYILPGVFTIPEELEAEIKDGKIIVRKKDGKRIQERLIEYFEGFMMGNANVKWQGLVVADILAWLKNQRSQELLERTRGLWDAIAHAKERALSFIEFLDKNSYAGKMCVSNPECEDIVNAFVEKDWAKLVAYANKYLRGAAEGRTAPLSSKCQEWIDAVENVAGAFPPGSKGYDMVIGSIHDLIKYLKSPCLENRLWSEEDEEMLQRIIRYTESEYQNWCNDKYGHSEIVSDGMQSCSERIDWLKALSERIKSLRSQPNNNLRWRRATEGANLPESIIIPDGEEPRFGKCAVKNSYYIPVEELKNLPKDGND